MILFIVLAVEFTVIFGIYPYFILQHLFYGSSLFFAGMAIASHRNQNRIAPLFPKKSHLQIASKPTKNHICYRISKLNKNNLQLSLFFNKLSTVLYLVVSCDCFVIIMFPGKEKFEFRYDLLCHRTLHLLRYNASITLQWDCNRGFQKVQIKYEILGGNMPKLNFDWNDYFTTKKKEQK